MARSQRERSQYNPLNLGTFSQTSVRLLIGDLGPRSEIIQGGYGNYTYDHWFQITIDKPAWIIAIKAGSKLATENINPLSNTGYGTNRRFSIAVYDQNRAPIEGRNINEKGSGYWNHVAGAQSDLYNTYDSKLASSGNELYFPLEPGNYLLCIAATCNELITYGVGLVIEFPSDDTQFILTEDEPTEAFVLQEALSVVPGSTTGFVEIPQVVNTDIVLNTVSAFTPDICTIINGNAVQVDAVGQQQNALTWYIGPAFPVNFAADERILLDATENWSLSVHSHDINVWRQAWARENLGNFPEFFALYAV